MRPSKMRRRSSTDEAAQQVAVGRRAGHRAGCVVARLACGLLVEGLVRSWVAGSHRASTNAQGGVLAPCCVLDIVTLGRIRLPRASRIHNCFDSFRPGYSLCENILKNFKAARNFCRNRMEPVQNYISTISQTPQARDRHEGPFTFNAGLRAGQGFALKVNY